MQKKKVLLAKKLQEGPKKVRKRLRERPKTVADADKAAAGKPLRGNRLTT